MRAICRRPADGMTLWSMAFVLVLIAFLSLTVIRLFPIYLNHFKVMTHLKEMAANPETDAMSKTEIKDALAKRFQVDGVEYVDLKEDLEIIVEGRDQQKTFLLNYEARVPFYSNLSVVGEFYDIKVEVVNN